MFARQAAYLPGERARLLHSWLMATFLVGGGGLGLFAFGAASGDEPNRPEEPLPVIFASDLPPPPEPEPVPEPEPEPVVEPPPAPPPVSAPAHIPARSSTGRRPRRSWKHPSRCPKRQPRRATPRTSPWPRRRRAREIPPAAPEGKAKWAPSPRSTRDRATPRRESASAESPFEIGRAHV